MSIVELDRSKIAAISQIETAIAELRDNYLGLTIAGPEDRGGFKAVYAARQDVKARRIAVEKARKDLKQDALDYGRLVDGEAKRITALLEPIESHLEQQEAAYTEAREALKRKAAEEARARLQARVDAMAAVGGVIPLAVLDAMTEAQFAESLAEATAAHEARKAAEEQARIERERQEAEARKVREAEEARIAADRAKLEAERRAAEEQARIEREKLEAERRKVEVENARIAAERQRIEREEFERQAKVRAEQEAREKLERERAEQERLAKEKAEREADEAKRRESMRPDLDKLRDFVNATDAVPAPRIEDSRVANTMAIFANEIHTACERCRKWIDEQANK